VVAPVLAVPVLLLPWSVTTWIHSGASSLFFEAGLPAPDLARPLSAWDVVLGRPGDAWAAPAWIGAAIVLAALVALLRVDTRRDVLRAWLVIVVALALTALLAGGSYALASSPVEQPVWLGFPLLVTQAAGICAAALAGRGIGLRLSGSSFGWRQPVGAVVVLAALLSPLVGLVWWVANGSGGALDRRPVTDVPTYMTDAAAADPDHGILEVRGSQATGFEYVLLRGSHVWLGEDSVLPSVHAQSSLTRLVTRLATAADPSDVDRLATHGVAFVYLPPPADTQLVGNLDSVSGVTRGSATRPGARAWQLDAAPTTTALPSPTTSIRRWILVLQGLAVVAVLVLAAPTRRVRR
jgi:hypothetical protein